MRAASSRALVPVDAGERAAEPFLATEPTGAPASSQPGAPERTAEADQGRVGPRNHSCIFPFRCFPIWWLPVVPTWLTRVKDWLHLVLLFGLGATLVLLGVVVERINEHEDLDFKFAVHLSCLLVVLPSTWEFIKVIRSWDDERRDLQAAELEEAGRLEEQKKLEEEKTRERLRGLSSFAEHMQDRFLDTQLNQIDTFVIQVRHANVREVDGVVIQVQSGAEDGDMLAEFKRLVLNFAEIFGQARLGFFTLAVVQGATDDRAVTNVQRLIAGEEKCQSIEDAFFAWEEAKRSINTGSTFDEVLEAWDNFKQVNDIVVKFLHHTEPGGLPSADDLERGCRSERCSRQCGGQARCGASWLDCVCLGGRPDCCRFERHEERDRTPFGANCLGVEAPYSLHVLGVVSLRVLSANHQFLMWCLLMDVVAIIANVSIPGMHFALALVLINTVCIQCMLLCFEQIDKDEQAVARLARTRAEVARLERRNAELQRLLSLQSAVHDLLLFRVFPLLDVIDKVATVSMKNHQALASGARIFGLANECVESANHNLGPVQAWLGDGRLDKGWKDKQGEMLRLAVKMPDVMKKNVLKEAADQVKALEDSLLGLKKASEMSVFQPRFVVADQAVRPAITAAAPSAGAMPSRAAEPPIAVEARMDALEEAQLGAAEGRHATLPQ